MAQNRRLLIALAIIVLVGIIIRFGFEEVRPAKGTYYAALPDETPNFRAVEVYVCPKCFEAIYETQRTHRYDDEARHVLENFQLYYKEPGHNGCCPNHPDQKLTQTVEIPIHPQVRFTLPTDTEYIHREYIEKTPSAAGASIPIDLTIVISSKNRRSIHRAESCLKAQGWTVHSQRFIKVKSDAAPNGELGVRSLLMETVVKDPETNRLITQRLVVFYWYAALPNRLTPSEYKRLATMFYDSIVKGINYRWSYVLISKYVNPNGGSAALTARELEAFVTEFSEHATKTAIPH